MAITDTISGSLRILLRSTLTVIDSANTLTTDTESALLDLTKSWTDGTGSGAAQIQAMGDLSLTAGAAATVLDLTAVPQMYKTVTFTKIKHFILYETAGTSGTTIELGGGANPFVGPFKDPSDIIVMHAGAPMIWSSPVDGYTVTASTGMNLAIAAKTHNATLQYFIIGEGSAAD